MTAPVHAALRRRWAGAALLGAVLLAVAAPAVTAGDNLGERIVRGRVYNLDRGEAVAIASATVSFRNLDSNLPGSSGLAVTDVNGGFAFALPLRSRDMVRLTASAPQFEAFTTSRRADQLVGRNPAIEIGLGAPMPGRHRVRGQLAQGPGCSRAAPNVQVRLRRAGLSTRSNTAGLFHFDGIENGDYILRIGRLESELPVTIAGQDQEVRFCVECPSLPTVTPRSAPPGALLRVESDECRVLGSAQLITVYFDDALVASTTSGPFGNFTALFDVPLWAGEGPHRVRVFTEPNAEIASAQVTVTAGCTGDCDRDGTVTIDELLRGVQLALGTPTLPCPAYGSTPVTIADLVGAVDNALRGCAAGDD